MTSTPKLDRRIAVGDGLRFDPLRRIDHQQGALAGRKRTRHLVGKIDVAGSIDQVQVVDLAAARAVSQGRSLGLDGDSALALDVHRVEHLRLHLAIGESAAQVDDAVGERRLAVIDVRDDREITDVLHGHGLGSAATEPPLKRKGASEHPWSNCRKARILADFAQIITDFAHLEEVMAEDRAGMQEDRDDFVIERFECRIGVDVEHDKVDAELGEQGFERLFHLAAEVTVVARNQGQRRHRITRRDAQAGCGW
jgi:hypothetical protein